MDFDFEDMLESDQNESPPAVTSLEQNSESTVALTLLGTKTTIFRKIRIGILRSPGGSGGGLNLVPQPAP